MAALHESSLEPFNTGPGLPDHRQEADDVGYEGDSSDQSGNRRPVSIIKTKTRTRRLYRAASLRMTAPVIAGKDRQPHQADPLVTETG